MKVEVAVLGFCRPNESYGFCGRKAPCFGTGHSLSLICQPTSEDMKLYIIIISDDRWACTLDAGDQGTVSGD